MRRLLPFAAIIIGVLILVTSFVVGNVYGHSRAEMAAAEDCSPPPSSTRTAAETPGGEQAAKATVEVQPGATTEFKFGRGVTAGPRRIPLDLSIALPVGSVLAVQPRPFVRGDGVQVARSAVRAWGV